MEKKFWLEKWENQDTAFHQSEGNHLFIKYFPHLNLKIGKKIFVPLCGKTFDMTWLTKQGFKVVGVELSEQAIQEYFQGSNLEPEISTQGSFKIYQSESLKIFVGDFFELNQNDLSSIDLVYDRASLVALPLEMRRRYTQHLRKLTNAQQLLITFDYDQSEMSGPPFSISTQEVQKHYQENFHIELLESVEISGGLKRITAATENIWKLSTKTNF